MHNNTINKLSYKKKWSILIITMFILIITSMIGILIVSYVKSMIAFTNKFHDYQSAFYMANAGLELQLIKKNNHWFGFESSMSSWSATIKNNFDCSANPWRDCRSTAKISTKSYTLWQRENITNDVTKCSDLLWYMTDENKIISSLYLFEDSQTDIDKEWNLTRNGQFRSIQNRNINIKIYWIGNYKLALQSSNSSWEIWNNDLLLTYTAETIDLNNFPQFFTALDPKDQVRVKIINDLKTPGTVCFESRYWDLKLPGFHTVIQSAWHYNNTVVNLQATITNIPGDEQDFAWWEV